MSLTRHGVVSWELAAQCVHRGIDWQLSLHACSMAIAQHRRGSSVPRDCRPYRRNWETGQYSGRELETRRSLRDPGCSVAGLRRQLSAPCQGTETRTQEWACDLLGPANGRIGFRVKSTVACDLGQCPRPRVQLHNTWGQPPPFWSKTWRRELWGGAEWVLDLGESRREAGGW